MSLAVIPIPMPNRAESPQMSDIMTPRPAVSVVMPAYNLAKFVGQSIESVLSQTYGDFELVIIDNGSTDNTADVIRSYKDERIKFLKVPSNLGPSLAVNIAIGHSTGKYVALLAADDYWTPEKLARQTAYLDSHPDTGAVFSLASVVDEEGNLFSDDKHVYGRVFEQPNRARHEWLVHFYKYGNCLCAVSSLVRRSVVEGDWYRPEMLQLSDFELWIRVVLRAGIHVVQEKLTCFRIRSHEANTSGVRLDVLRRCAFEECVRIAPLFVSGEALGMLHLVFPELGGESVGWSAVQKRWRLAGLFAGHEREAWRIFGLTLQADLLGNAASRDELVQSLGAAVFSEHFQASGKAAPFEIRRCLAKIYWPEVGGFSEARSAGVEYLPGRWVRLIFSIPAGRTQAVLRVDPCEGSGAVELKNIAITKASDAGSRRLLGSATLLSHAGCQWVDANRLLFVAFSDPQLVFRMPEGWGDAQVTLEVDLMCTPDIGDALNAIGLKSRIGSWLSRVFRKAGWKR